MTVLTFIGAKMLLGAIGLHIPIKVSLGVVALVLVGSVVASLVFPPKGDTTIQVDLPPDFDLPLGEELNEQDREHDSEAPEDAEKAEKTLI